MSKRSSAGTTSTGAAGDGGEMRGAVVAVEGQNCSEDWESAVPWREVS